MHERWKTPRPAFLLARYHRGVAFPPGYDRDRLRPFAILIRSSNWLGDAVMSVPAVRAIKAGRPDARVTILVPEKLAGFWRGLPEVDAVETIGSQESLWKVGRRLGDRFDVAVIFPNSLRTGLEPWLGRIPRRTAYPGQARRWLLNQIFEPEPAEAVGPPSHQVNRYLDLAKWLGAEMLAGPEVGSNRTRGAKARIGIGPGAEYGAAKRYPAERFLEAARLVGEKREVEWTLFGVAADAPAGRIITEGLGEKCRNLIGETTLEELRTELSHCDLLLTNDTGTMHLAAHLGVPVVAVFGSTEPALTGPLGDGHTIVRRHVECSPCFLRECPLDFRCMLELEPSVIASAVLEHIRAPGPI